LAHRLRGRRPREQLRQPDAPERTRRLRRLNYAAGAAPYTRERVRSLPAAGVRHQPSTPAIRSRMTATHAPDSTAPAQRNRGRLGTAARIVCAALLAGLLAACHAPVRLMPTPASFSNGDVDPFEKIGAKLQTTEVPVFYATNRVALIEHPDPIHTIVP